MKTPTLIVRLIGIYLVVKSCVGMLGISQAKRVMGSFAVAVDGGQSTAFRTESLFVVLMLLIGIFIAWHAGTLARILTFDAEPDVYPGRRSRELEADEVE